MKCQLVNPNFKENYLTNILAQRGVTDIEAFLNSKNAVVKALYKYSPYIIALKPLAKIIYDVIYDRILAKGVEHDFKHLSVDIKRYDDNSVLCIIKFNNTTLSFLMEKEK